MSDKSENSADTPEQVSKPDPNQAFYEKAMRALRDLFDKARAKHELHFAMALMPEFRGAQDGGWNKAEEAVYAYDQFVTHIKSLKKDEPIRVRIALALYLQVAEGSGFYEIPKKLLLTVEGKGNNIMPFHSLVKRHQKAGRAIDPNANAIMRDLMGHAYDLQLFELSEVFYEAFDSDLRNAVAHADYIIAPDALRIRKKNGGYPRKVSWAEFDAMFCRGVNLFSFIRQLTEEYVRGYDPPKVIKSRLNEREPITDFTIYYDPKTRAFGFKTDGRNRVPNSAS